MKTAIKGLTTLATAFAIGCNLYFPSESFAVEQDKQKRVAFIFVSFRDDDSADPIDKNLSWRSVGKTYQAMRDLGIQKENFIILYNKGKPNKEDNDIPLKAELDSLPILEGTYDELCDAFRKKTRNLTSLDEVILTTLSHGTNEGILYPDFGDAISRNDLNRILNRTSAKTVAFYSACHSGSLLEKAYAKNAVQVATTDIDHMSWSDRNYCDNADFFEAFTKPSADLDKNGKVSFEEAAAYSKNKWMNYRKTFLDNYLLNDYIWSPMELISYPNKQALLNEISCDPIVKRGKNISNEWTLEKK